MTWTRTVAGALGALLTTCACAPGHASIPSPPPSPSPTVAPTAAALPSPPPSPSPPIPLVVHAAAGSSIYWTDAAGALHQALWSDLTDREVGSGQAHQSPDGSELYGLDRLAVVTYAGTPVGPYPTFGPKGLYGWADDSLHFCALTGTYPASGTTPTTLSVSTPGGDPAAVAEVGWQGGQAGPSLQACSFRSGRAVVTQTCVSTVCDLWIVSLRSGAVLYESKLGFPAVPTTSVFASGDGRYIAVANYRTGHVEISEPLSSSVTASLDGGWYGGFSGDGRLCWLASDSGVSVFEWRSGRLVWNSPKVLGSSVRGIPEPGGGRLAIAVGSGAVYPAPAEIYVVSPDGSTTRLALGVIPAF